MSGLKVHPGQRIDFYRRYSRLLDAASCDDQSMAPKNAEVARAYNLLHCVNLILTIECQGIIYISVLRKCIVIAHSTLVVFAFIQ